MRRDWQLSREVLVEQLLVDSQDEVRLMIDELIADPAVRRMFEVFQPLEKDTLVPDLDDDNLRHVQDLIVDQRFDVDVGAFFPRVGWQKDALVAGGENAVADPR